MRGGGWLVRRFRDEAGYRHRKDELGAGSELNSAAVAGDLVAATGALGWQELEIGDADDNSRMNGVRWAAGIEVLVEGARVENSLADLANASCDFGGRLVVHVMRLAGRANHRNHPQFEGLFIAVIAVGTVEIERELA